MLFSIIIPAYNLGELIVEAIESCLRQKDIEVEDFEIIVIDDGSCDDTLKYITQYQNYENLTIISQENKGLSCARNIGISKANGDFIIFLDGDDWLDIHALSKLKCICEKNYLTVFPLTYYYTKDKIVKDNFSLSSGTYSTSNFIHNTIGKGHFNVIPAQCKLYPRWIFEDNSTPFIPGILHEDNPFFIYILQKFDSIKFFDENIYFYRQQREGAITSHNSIRNFKGIITGIKNIQQLASYKSPDINYLILSLHIFQVINKYNDCSEKEIFSYYRKPRQKFEILRLLINQSLRVKILIKSILLFIDPRLLRIVINSL